jgi:PBP1b-binding outer membrane lipoprotein LpoB
MKKTLTFLSAICACALLLTGCVQSHTAPMTQLQTREIQTRDFDTANTKLVMKTMMNVLQDEGFIVKNAVMDIGLLSAEKNIDVENTSKAVIAVLLGGAQARWSKQQTVEASANISEFGAKTRVRINFQTKLLDNFGCPQEVITITDLTYYRAFFDKVSKGLFLQEQGI